MRAGRGRRLEIANASGPRASDRLRGSERPVGRLAGELALAGVDVAIVERYPTPDLIRPRARGMLTRTIEILDQRGIAEGFISQGQNHEVSMFAGASFKNDLPTRHNYVLIRPDGHVAWVEGASDVGLRDALTAWFGPPAA